MTLTSTDDHATAEPPDPDLLDELAQLILGLAARMQVHRNACAAEFDLTPALAKALRELEPGKPIPMRELALRLNCDASNLTGLVDRLEDRGAAERRPDLSDRRVKTLVLTEEGVRLRHGFWKRLLTEAGPLSEFTPDQARALRDLLLAGTTTAR